MLQIVVSALAASSWLSCVHTFNGTRYDLSPLRDAVFAGTDPDYPDYRQYNVSVCSSGGRGLPAPCRDELTKVPYNGSVYQLTLDAPGGRPAFCWDVLASTAPPQVLAPGSTGDATAPGEALVLRFSHSGDAHIDCPAAAAGGNMTVDVHVACAATAAAAGRLVGRSDRACHYRMVLTTPHACHPANPGDAPGAVDAAADAAVDAVAPAAAPAAVRAGGFWAGRGSSAPAVAAAAGGQQLQPPYGDPFRGPCNPRELNMSVHGVPGLYCAPPCDNAGPAGCGTAKPAGTHASPECMIAVNGSMDNYCALVCQTYDAKSCDAAAGAKCYSVGGVTGVCAFAS